MLCKSMLAIRTQEEVKSSCLVVVSILSVVS